MPAPRSAKKEKDKLRALGQTGGFGVFSDEAAELQLVQHLHYCQEGARHLLLPVAEEYKKILLVEPAVADAITGDKWNKYIFRTGRNSSQDAAANAVALDQPGNVVALLANDNAFGRDGVKATKDFMKKAKIVHEEYLPVGTTDFTAGIQRLVDATDYPDSDVAAVNETFLHWKHDKAENIMGYRDKSYRSLMTGTLSPKHHTPWLEELDDSMETYLKN
eukprot:gene53025-64772_t